MLTQEWIDPRDVDFTDPFNPLARPRWYKDRNPWLYKQFTEDPIWLALRHARNLDVQILVCPDPADQIIAPNATYEQSMAIEPYTWLYGFNISASQPATGFYFQVTDAVSGATLFSQQALSKDFSPNNSTGKICFLSTPMYFTPPSYPIVRIVNLAGSAQTCTVNLFTAIELEPAIQANIQSS